MTGLYDTDILAWANTQAATLRRLNYKEVQAPARLSLQALRLSRSAQRASGQSRVHTCHIRG